MVTKFPAWDESDPQGSLAAIYAWAVENASGQILWYQEKKGSKRRGSQVLRALSIAFGAIGVLCPLIDATLQEREEWWWVSPVDLGEFGYVFIALGAALLAYDRYFGLSTGWIRYILTQMSLEKAVKELHHEWAQLMSEKPAAGGERELLQAWIEQVLERLKVFTLQVEALVRQETDAWALEFQRNIAELEKTLKSESEARKPGSIRFVVPNAAAFDRVVLRVDGAEARELTAGTEDLWSPVSPGHHTAGAVGRRSGKEDVWASKVIEVPPGGLVTAELTLPSPKEPEASP